MFQTHVKMEEPVLRKQTISHVPAHHSLLVIPVKRLYGAFLTHVKMEEIALKDFQRSIALKNSQSSTAVKRLTAQKYNRNLTILKHPTALNYSQLLFALVHHTMLAFNVNTVLDVFKSMLEEELDSQMKMDG